jgi:hypothetical protein
VSWAGILMSYMCVGRGLGLGVQKDWHISTMVVCGGGHGMHSGPVRVGNCLFKAAKRGRLIHSTIEGGGSMFLQNTGIHPQDCIAAFRKTTV